MDALEFRNRIFAAREKLKKQAQHEQNQSGASSSTQSSAQAIEQLPALHRIKGHLQAMVCLFKE